MLSWMESNVYSASTFSGVLGIYYGEGVYVCGVRVRAFSLTYSFGNISVGLVKSSFLPEISTRNSHNSLSFWPLEQGQALP